MNQLQVENLLAMSREATDFEHELGFTASPASTCATGPKAPAMHGAGASPLVHWSAMAAAAAVMLALGVWFTVVRQPAAIPAAIVFPTIAKIESKTTAPAVCEEPNVNMVVALFRDDDTPSDECPACWCVTQWSADWGTGRDITKVQGAELLAASKDRQCVARPQQVIVVGLSGPASAMPASDDLARQLALCIAEKHDEPAAQVSNTTGYKPAAAQPSCLPIGVDYRLATWTR